ncbi:unnamed protein product [Rotaria socialis]|uniref:Uncharacterized protein n=1 Tax=Rotaria socialis TaxID=392032 RepID=A0A817TTH3_9BILA|nr:unnamed protein product [Rotaria socialis]
MHNKLSEPTEFNHGNRSIRKSKWTSNLSIVSKKKINGIPSIKIEIDVDNKLETNKSSPTVDKTNGNLSPNHRRRPKRSSVNNNAFLSTIGSVHELMSFVIYKDNPPSWLKQTDLYKEYKKKSEQINTENLSSVSPPHYHQQLHRKQRCNLQMYARSSLSWQSLPSPPLLNLSLENYSNESTHKNKRDTNISPIYASSLSSSSSSSSSSPSASSSSMMDFTLPLNISIKSEPAEQNSTSTPNKSKPIKQSSSTVTTRRQHMLCKKKIPQNGARHPQRMNSVEDLEALERKDLSSSSQHDSNTSTSSSSIEHTSPSPTTTVSGSSSQHSSPAEYMRGYGSINTRLSSPLRIQTSISPHLQSLSTSQRRSTRIWAPSSFYINPMWIIPTAATSKRSVTQNSSLSPSPSSETNQRPKRLCRS